MASAKKKNGKKHTGRRFLKLVSTLVLLLLMLMVVQGHVVQLRCVDLPLRDLPPAFDGTKIVYLSDLHMTTLNSPGKISAMMEQLQMIQPDLLLLGGDYNGNDILGQLAVQTGREIYGSRQAETRELFFLSLADFTAPLGKFAVAGDMDNLVERNAQTSLSGAAAMGGVRLLRDEAVRIEKDGQTLVLVGVDDWRTGLQDIRSPARGLRSGDCVILLAHNPEAIPQLTTQPGEDGGRWIDAALTGHTLGGQIKIGGREIFNPLAGDERYSAGWHLENGAKLLISEGLCGSFLPLRLGTSAEVHVITLRCQTTE